MGNVILGKQQIGKEDFRSIVIKVMAQKVIKFFIEPLINMGLITSPLRLLKSVKIIMKENNIG